MSVRLCCPFGAVPGSRLQRRPKRDFTSSIDDVAVFCAIAGTKKALAIEQLRILEAPITLEIRCDHNGARQPGGPETSAINVPPRCRSRRLAAPPRRELQHAALGSSKK